MAGRPRTPIGTWGEISTFPTATGHEARTRFRDADGKLRLVSARAPTKGKATNRLKTKLSERAKEAFAPGGGGITPATTVRQLCDTWLERKEREDVTPQTIVDYTSTIRGAIAERIGDITLREATAGRISTFLDGMTPGVRRRATTILVQAFRLAQSHDAVATNPVDGIVTPTQKRDPVEVLTLEQLVDLRKGVRSWLAGTLTDDGQPADEGPKQRAWDLDWFVDLMLATGCRPGEMTAVRWCDIDLEAEQPTMLINATMVMAGGLRRQPWPKSKRARLLTLPPYAVQTLAVMREAQHNPDGEAPLFPSRAGTHRDPSNIRKQWRQARRAAGRGETDKWSWVTFRVMRRTVATVIDRAGADTDAAAQLGHSGVAVTRRHYIAARAAQAPDLTAVLETFAA